jgi:peptide/nickel transport system permease protein
MELRIAKPKALQYKWGKDIFHTPWLNSKLITGGIFLLIMVLIGVIGPYHWDVTLARVGSGPLNLPPAWIENGNVKYPLGTENSGRDMLALLITGVQSALLVGVIASGVGLTLGILLGFSAGFTGGWTDNIIRTLTDAALTIPSLAVLVVISAFLKSVNVVTMALLLAAFSWAGPTRVIRSQILTLRERGYVKIARVSGSSTLSIMFGEILPNLLPFVASLFTSGVSGAILASSGLEALGLGPSRIPTLGLTIKYALDAAAITRGMWWWWGMPIAVLIMIFISMFFITIGLDEIANPRLRGMNQ